MGGGVSANRFARYYPTTGVWSALGSGISSDVTALAVLQDGDVIVGGSFTIAGGVAANRVARYNPTTDVWTALGSGISDVFGGGYVNALAVLPDGDVIAGGGFSTAGGVAANSIARCNPTTNAWSAMGSGTDDFVEGLAVLPNGDVIVGGGFTIAGGLAASNIARCNPSTGVWSALGSGTSSYVEALAVLPDGDVIVGGGFLEAGGNVSAYFARYTFGAPAPTIATQPDPTSACPGGTSTFFVTANGTDPFTYQWRKDSIAIDTIANPSAATAELSLSDVQAVDAGSYDCVVTTACGSVTCDPATLTVLDPSDAACLVCPLCPADYDDNGGVDGGDLAAFFSDFENGESCADVDGNGGVDGGDLGYFFTVFEAGGC